MTFKQALKNVRNYGLKLEARAELSIDILSKIVYKNKPTPDDIKEIKKVINLLKKD